MSVSAQTGIYKAILLPAKNTDLGPSEGPLLEFEMEAGKRERCWIAGDGWFEISEGLQSTILEFHILLPHTTML